MTLEHDPLYRPKLAAKFTGNGRSSLYAAVKRGDLEAPEPVGLRAVAWRESQLRRYLEKMKARPRVQPAPNCRREAAEPDAA